MKTVSVAINIGTYKQFTYYSEEEELLFKRVKIPFGKYPRIGVVTDFIVNYKEGKYKTKKVSAVLDETRFVSKYHFDYLNYLTKNLLLPPGKTYMLSYPPFYTYNGEIGFSNKKNTENILSLAIGFSVEIIIKKIKQDLKKGRKIKLIFPDYSLLKKFSSEFKKKQNFNYSEVYSGGNKEIFWEKYLSGEIDIILGILYPLFIPDYENTVNYIIDEGATKFNMSHPFPVNLIDVAILNYIYKQNGLRIFSLSPSLKIYKFIEETDGEIIKTGDKKHSVFFTKPQKRVLSKEIKEEIERNLPRKKILLIVNRTGANNYLYCPRCKTIGFCPNDKSALTFEEKSGKIICSTCGKMFDFPIKCEICGKNLLVIKKKGTKLLKNSLEKHLNENVNQKEIRKKTKIEIYSRKIVGKTKEEERIFKRFKNGETDILIGTNLAIKPFEFNNLSLIIYFYPEFDLSEINPEISEKLFYNLQAMNKMVDENGKIIIKSDYPDFYVIEEFKNYDYEHFYKIETDIRKKLEYFPIKYFIKIEVRSIKKTNGLKKIKRYKKFLEQKEEGIQIFGPFYTNKKSFVFFSLILKGDSLQKIINLINREIIPFSDNSTFFYINRL